MPKTSYLQAPLASTTMPRGIPYIIANEAAERFSYYGMKAILTIFMTKYLLGEGGALAPMPEEVAKGWFHVFGVAVYGFPLLGALVADIFLGKYKTILSLSIVYCGGHLALALDDTRTGLAIGLTLIAIGSGGIKPCVSAHVGDQFGKSNAHLLEKVFLWFYFSINLGAFLSALLTPILLDRYGPHVAFGLPGVLMGFATLFFWMGRRVFIHIPPGGRRFVREAFSREGFGSLLKLFVIYVFVAMFWSLFDQTGSAWVLQAERLDRNLFGIEWLSSQVQAINPILVMLFIPLCSFVLYPALNRFFRLSPLRKIAIGFFITVPAFLLPAWIEGEILRGELPSIGWQLAAYVIITLAEVFVSITCLEFSYTQAPKSMKSLVMATFLLSVSLGNVFTAAVNFLIQEEAPAFTSDRPGAYELELVVSDGQTRARKRLIVDVAQEPTSPPPAAPSLAASEGPTADAGRDMATRPGQGVRLYGQVDHGGVQGERRYVWSILARPTGSRSSPGELEGADTRHPLFTPDLEGEYVLELVYHVGSTAASDTARVEVTKTNLPPVIELAPTGTAKVGEPVLLDASGSYDPEGQRLTFAWKLVRKPEGSQVERVERAWRAASGSKLSGPSYYLFFAWAMLGAAILFLPVAYFYREKTYLQDELPAEGGSEAGASS